jgi:hypothetical protein
MIRTSSILPTAGYSTHNQEIFEKSSPLSSSYNSRQLFANNFLSKSVSYEATIVFCFIWSFFPRDRTGRRIRRPNSTGVVQRWWRGFHMPPSLHQPQSPILRSILFLTKFRVRTWHLYILVIQFLLVYPMVLDYIYVPNASQFFCKKQMNH